MKGLLLNENLGIRIVNGSMVIGETTIQNQQLLLLAEKADFKYKPMRGVGARRFLESNQVDDLSREIRTEFIADGMTVKSIAIPEDGNLKIDANYDH